MNFKLIIAGVAIFATGGAVGAYVSKKYFEDRAGARADEEIEEMRHFFTNQVLDCAVEKSFEEKVNEIPGLSFVPVKEDPKLKVEYEKIAANYTRNEELKANMDISKMIVGIDLGRVEDEDEDPGYPEDFSEPQEGRGGDFPAPYVISVEEYHDDFEKSNEFSLNDKEALLYYDQDETLADEAEEIISDVNSVIGDGLLSFGEQSEDEDTVYIRNERLGIDYEVIRMDKSYQETVLGITPLPVKRRRAIRAGEDK